MSGNGNGDGSMKADKPTAHERMAVVAALGEQITQLIWAHVDEHGFFLPEIVGVLDVTKFSFSAGMDQLFREEGEG